MAHRMAHNAKMKNRHRMGHAIPQQDELPVHASRRSPAQRTNAHSAGGRSLMLAAGLLAGVLAFTACSSDVVATWAVTSFDRLLAATGTTAESGASPDGGWQLVSPDGDRFVWSRDFSRTDLPDAALSFDAAPFLAAGLDPALLPADRFRYDAEAGRLAVTAELSDAPFDATAAATPLGAFREIVRTSRGAIGYHEALDHYGIALGGGNMLEWAKDSGKNDKDLVFVLDPKTLQDAGLKPDALQGWKLAPVKTKDADGRPIEVEKLLKPFDLVH